MDIYDFVKYMAKTNGEALTEVFGAEYSVVVVAIKKPLETGSKAVFGVTGLDAQELVSILGQMTLDLRNREGDNE